MKKLISCLLVAACMAATSFAASPAPAKAPMLVSINTTMGEMIVTLYDDTPLHRDNFIKNVGEGRYDGVLFHRVIDAFMIQSGDFNSRGAKPGVMLGEDTEKRTVPAEFRFPERYHKRGTLCAAREGDQTNPQKASSAAQFYIVTGKVFTDEQLDQVEQRRNIRYTPGQRTYYKTWGGTPHLDNNYTVFGEVVYGMDVADRIQAVATDRNDRPLEDVKVISMKVLRR